MCLCVRVTSKTHSHKLILVIKLEFPEDIKNEIKNTFVPSYLVTRLAKMAENLVELKRTKNKALIPVIRTQYAKLQRFVNFDIQGTRTGLPKLTNWIHEMYIELKVDAN